MKILNGKLLEAGLCVGMLGLEGRKKNFTAKELAKGKKRDSGEIRTGLGWISLSLDHPSVQTPQARTGAAPPPTQQSNSMRCKAEVP